MDGKCEVSPKKGIALQDTFAVSCTDWNDPEGAGIQQYVIEGTTRMLSLYKW